MFVATITRSQVHAHTIGSVLAAINAGVVAEWGVEIHGPYLANARNACVRRLLATDHTKLLFVDSDVNATVDDFATVTRLCTPETPVVGAQYMNPTGEPGELGVVAYDYVDGSGYVRTSTAAITSHDGDLAPVGAIGTGFMCIHRTLLERMAEKFPEPTPWFTDLGLFDNYIGEDLAFCHRVRGEGYPVLATTQCRVGHYKELLI